MKAHAKVDAGVCGFKTKVTAETRDGMNVELRIGSDCETIQELAGLLKARNPIDAYQELTPVAESVVLSVCRPVLQKKGCCEACVVPAAICKAMQVAAKLALPRDVVVQITKGEP
ncbi:hypothetical protein DSCA_46960 [Desulfosarcina alkanivorans]|jgi:hypothetical protein|uniref:Uncharacterized protein n=1 Tax=Desulfosarcina alkanivorans TaxID=571177 RepID=A0A5K7YNI1_9BACT|nr:hypothetical protein [Desulfosarcina alkanivorans]BBO70766.1 hypothetical protein DSCA_46960 [Desulfosarcina alkanivorans]